VFLLFVNELPAKVGECRVFCFLRTGKSPESTALVGSGLVAASLLCLIFPLFEVFRMAGSDRCDIPRRGSDCGGLHTPSFSSAERNALYDLGSSVVTLAAYCQNGVSSLRSRSKSFAHSLSAVSSLPSIVSNLKSSSLIFSFVQFGT
jgi:hypothetical protein